MTEKTSKRYIGKIQEKEVIGDDHVFTSKKIKIDNPNVDSQYHKGVLIWFDKVNKTYNQVLEMQVLELPEDSKSREYGYTKNVIIDLDNPYSIKELE